MDNLEKYLKKIDKDLELKLYPQKKSKTVFVISGFPIQDYQLRIIDKERIIFSYSKSNIDHKNPKFKLVFTYLKLNCEFDGVKVEETEQGLEFNPKSLNLNEKFEFELWVIRMVEAILNALKEYIKNI